MPINDDSHGWLVLLHQLPAKPPYLRVKLWRRLQALGALPLKNAVHVLPRSDAANAAFSGLLGDIIADGGEAVLLEARLVTGQSDVELRAQFDAARDADYGEIAHDARRLIEAAPVGGAEIDRLKRRMAEVVAFDFFGAHGRQGAEAALRELDERRFQHPDIGRVGEPLVLAPADLQRRTWVTRRGVHVDRIGSAWLIRRFIDPDAAFKFVDGNDYAPGEGELRFDMVQAEFTHEGDRCSFETLMLRAELGGDTALVVIGELIHELDITDGKFNRAETAGLGAMLNGLCAATVDDLERIARGSDVLDQLYAWFSSRKADR